MERRTPRAIDRSSSDWRMPSSPRRGASPSIWAVLERHYTAEQIAELILDLVRYRPGSNFWLASGREPDVDALIYSWSSGTRPASGEELQKERFLSEFFDAYRAPDSEPIEIAEGLDADDLDRSGAWPARWGRPLTYRTRGLDAGGDRYGSNAHRAERSTNG